MTTTASPLTPPSPAELRAELERLVLLDLLGPAGGAEEEIAERSVRDRYLVGMLAPRQQQIAPEEHADLNQAGEDAPDDGPIDRGVSQAPSMFPSSFGLTFCVDGAATAIQVTASWGRYHRVKSEYLITEKTGEPLTVWQRQPMDGPPHAISLAHGPIAPYAPDPEQAEVKVRGLVRQAEDGWIVTLFLVNAQAEPEKLRDLAWIFQPELRVAAPDGRAIFQRRAPLHVSEQGDPVTAAEAAAMAMRYRDTVEFAVGHGISVHADVSPTDPTCAERLTTVVVPTYEVPRTIAPTPAEQPALAGLVVDMKVLAEVADGGFASVLTPLVAAYRAWIDAQGTRIHVPAARLDGFPASAHEALERCREALARIASGIELLDANPQAATAFRFMNRAMWQQRVHTLLSEAVRRGQQPDLATIDIPKERSWRPFQLAFILLNLPSLTDLHHPDRSVAPTALADLRWFPTGGGKTEAYLGLTAYTLGIRRLQGVVDRRSGMDGVAVLMRYTLRLLTLQQFQRAATLICACEIIRREHPQRWGRTPFRIGLWVGQRTTPNSTEQSDDALKREHGQYSRASAVGGSGSPAQLTNCPWCGAKIQPEKGHIRVEKVPRRTLTICGTLQRVKGKLVRSTPKTDRSTRTLPIPPTLLAALRAYMADQQEKWPAAQYLFLSTTGTPIEPMNLRNHFKKVAKEIGIPAKTRFHDLRHSCATFLIASGEHPRVIMQTLGHSQISTTMDVYGHVLEETHRQAVDRLDALLADSEEDGQGEPDEDV